MRSKIIAVFLVMILCFGSFLIIPSNIIVHADSGDQENSQLNTGFIWNVTTNLSNIIFQSYNSSELQKGRAFGSKGERYAADYIENEMNQMGLSNVHKEQITNVSGSDDLISVLRDGDGNLTTKLDIQDIGCHLNNTGDIQNVDCYISPRRNDSRQSYFFHPVGNNICL